MQTFNVNGRLILKIEWKQTDGRTEAIALSPTLMWSAIIRLELMAHYVAYTVDVN